MFPPTRPHLSPHTPSIFEEEEEKEREKGYLLRVPVVVLDSRWRHWLHQRLDQVDQPIYCSRTPAYLFYTLGNRSSVFLHVRIDLILALGSDVSFHDNSMASSLAQRESSGHSGREPGSSAQGG
jgi:hypothetical protein